jgi:methionyl-tRNA formyltransferase
MRVLVVIDETPFFHPEFLANLIQRSPDDFVGAALVTKPAAKSNIDAWLRRNWFRLRPLEIFKLAWRKVKSIASAKLVKPGPEHFYSVRAVLDYYKIAVCEVHENVNRREYLDFIRSKSPDVVLSSCSVIFGGELLKVPPRGCINRHSALLPAFGGVWPVFQAVRSGEAVTGVTVHTMEKGIDRGVVLSQMEIPITKGTPLYSLYEQCFALSVDACLLALEKVRSGNLEPIVNGRERSYFSFPTPEHWKQFRAHGGRFV